MPRLPALLTRAVALTAAALLAAPAGASGPFAISFASGSARIDATGERILDNAAIWLHGQGAEALWIEANADRVGSRAANMRLSGRRGEAVRAGLVRRGFAPERVRVVANGEDRPLVETQDGVAEPQNRFVLFFMEPAPASAASRPRPQPQPQ